jgi:hypothetical protein
MQGRAVPISAAVVLTWGLTLNVSTGAHSGPGVKMEEFKGKRQK